MEKRPAFSRGSGRKLSLSKLTIREICRSDLNPWSRMRRQLWPDCTHRRNACELVEYFEGVGRKPGIIFVAILENAGPVGFLEGNIRTGYVEGSREDRVGYLEGIFVESHSRRLGIARRLLKAFEDWLLEHECPELGSDCLLRNVVSRKLHENLGFREVSRNIHFIRNLSPKKVKRGN